MSKQLTPVQQLKGTLTNMAPQFKAALPAHINVDKFVRVLQTAVSQNPGLMKADRTSLLAACMKSSQDGLLPDGREAALVTFGNQASYMPMVAGILKKVRNSGELASITSQIICANDDFTFYVDEDGEHLSHKPDMLADRGEPRGVYALAKTKDGAVYIEVMTKDEVMAVKNVSRGKNGPWSGAFASEMWRKTAIKRLSKRLPMSTDLEQTLDADNDLYEIEKPAPEREVEQPTQSARLEELITKPEEKNVTPDDGAEGELV